MAVEARRQPYRTPNSANQHREGAVAAVLLHGARFRPGLDPAIRELFFHFLLHHEAKGIVMAGAIMPVDVDAHGERMFAKR